MSFSAKKTLIATAIMALVAPFSMTAFAVDGPVINDAYVNIGNSGANFGADARLIVDGRHASYIRVDLSTLPPGTTSSQISHASMLLWVAKVDTGGIVDVSPVTDSWDEHTITGSTIPAAGRPVATVQVSPGNLNQYVVIDLTELVKIWVDYPNQNHGVVLRPITTLPVVAVSFDSKEAESSHGGMLDITMQAMGATGPAGPKGDTGAQGIPGVKGDKSDTGATGAVGAQGPIGPQGQKGDIGLTGVKGDVGPQGAPANFSSCKVITSPTGSSSPTYGFGSIAQCGAGSFAMGGACIVNASAAGTNTRIIADGLGRPVAFECILTQFNSNVDAVHAQVICCN
jgi:hypothetical protein